MSGSMIPSWYIESTYVLIALVRGIVGSVSILSYMELSERWLSPSLTYCSVSSTTIPEPLSALLITRVWSDCRSLRAFICEGFRFGVTVNRLRAKLNFIEACATRN